MTDTPATTKPKRTRKPVDMAASTLASRFRLAAYWYGGTWCPAVSKRSGGGYQIRILRAETTRGRTTTTNYDYFYIDPDGVITASPRGEGSNYNRRVRLTGLDELVAEHATPQPGAARL